MKWIPISEKSPEVRERVWLKISIEGEPPVVTGKRLEDVPDGNNPWFHAEGGILCGTESVSHWMPLPSPPFPE